jgi:hypothetical protein
MHSPSHAATRTGTAKKPRTEKKERRIAGFCEVIWSLVLGGQVFEQQQKIRVEMVDVLVKS